MKSPGCISQDSKGYPSPALMEAQIPLQTMPEGQRCQTVQIANLEVFNHAVSAKKFRIIQMFLELGYNVFLSDIDIVVLRVTCSAGSFADGLPSQTLRILFCTLTCKARAHNI